MCFKSIKEIASLGLIIGSIAVVYQGDDPLEVEPTHNPEVSPQNNPNYGRHFIESKSFFTEEFELAEGDEVLAINGVPPIQAFRVLKVLEESIHLQKPVTIAYRRDSEDFIVSKIIAPPIELPRGHHD